jgi:hypothetical protein
MPRQKHAAIETLRAAVQKADPPAQVDEPLWDAAFRKVAETAERFP